MSRSTVPVFDGPLQVSSVEEVRDLLQTALIKVSGDLDVCTDDVDSEIYGEQYDLLCALLCAISGPSTHEVMPS